jgi:hypothetical protein
MILSECTQSLHTQGSPFFVPLWGDRSSGVTLCLWSHQTPTVTRCGSQEWQTLQVFHMTHSRYDMESTAIIYPFQTQWLLHIAPPALTNKNFHTLPTEYVNMSRIVLRMKSNYTTRQNIRLILSMFCVYCEQEVPCSYVSSLKLSFAVK